MDVCIESFRKVICDVEHPFADLSYSQGELEHEQHYIAEQTFQLVLRKSMIRLVHHDIYKGGAHSEISIGTQGELIMHCWHYGGHTEGDLGSWSDYCCNLSLSWSFMVFGGLCFFFTDLVHIQGEHALRGSITLCP